MALSKVLLVCLIIYNNAPITFLADTAGKVALYGLNRTIGTDYFFAVRHIILGVINSGSWYPQDTAGISIGANAVWMRLRFGLV
jgi:hypothetical protein